MIAENWVLNRFVLILLVSVLVVALAFSGTKAMLASLFVVILTTILFVSNNKQRLALLIISIGFPITLQVSGKDAITTSTILIFVYISWLFLMSGTKVFKGISRDAVALISFALVMIAFINTVFVVEALYKASALRSSISFLSAVFLYVIVTNYRSITLQSITHDQKTTLVIDLLIGAVVIQLMIGIAVMLLPDIQDYLSVFFRREQDSLALRIGEGYKISRIATVIFGAEQIGEVVAISYPIVLCKYLFSIGRKKLLYAVYLLTLLIGLVLSGTRSGIVLVLSITILFYFMRVPVKISKEKWILVGVGLGVLVLSLLLIPQVYATIIERMMYALDKANTGSEYIEVMNRTLAWDEAMRVTSDKLNILGNGPLQAVRMNLASINFHNLYFTIVFQYGLLGALLFVILILIVLSGLINTYQNTTSYDNKMLAFAAILSFLSFLVNEVKFEFNREVTYQQVVYCYLALYVLISRSNFRSTRHIGRDNEKIDA